MATFLQKFISDPKKGIDCSWKACQDKLLDVLGPLTKILDMAKEAKLSGSIISPECLSGWAQRAIVFLGNANCALSTERRRSLLIKWTPSWGVWQSPRPDRLLKVVCSVTRSLKNWASLSTPLRPWIGHRHYKEGFPSGFQRGQSRQGPLGRPRIQSARQRSRLLQRSIPGPRSLWKFLPHQGATGEKTRFPRGSCLFLR